MKRYVITGLILTCLAATYAGPFDWQNKDKKLDQRQCEMNNMHRNKENMHKMLVKELNLTKEQVYALDKIREGNSRDMKRLHARMWKERQKMHKELISPHLDEREINRSISKIMDAQKELLEQRVQMMKEHRKILTNAQQQKLFELMEKNKDRFLKRKGDDAFKGKWDEDEPASSHREKRIIYLAYTN